jgi:allantoinase
MIFDKALHSRRVVLPNGVKEATIFIKDGKIIEITEGAFDLGFGMSDVGNTPPTSQIPNPKLVDLGDAVIMSGLIDPHVHINEPGRTDWEGFDTATRAAAAGGITSMIEMPLNASPVTTTLAAFEQKLAATEGKLHVNCGFYGGLIPSNYDDLAALMAAGVFGIKCFLTHSGIDEFPNVTEADLAKAMPLIKEFGLPILAHCELDGAHTKQIYFQKNPKNYVAYLHSRPKSWENRAIALMLRLCEATQCRTHIVHLSSADLVGRLRNAKKTLPLTVETTPQYLAFSAEEIPDGQTVFKCAPPIRERANNDKLWSALHDKTIDFIGSDHSPAPPHLKQVESGNLAKAWGGIAGLQFTLPVVWTAAEKRGFSIEDIARILSENPAKFLGLSEKGQIKTGFDADLVVWQPEKTVEITVENIHHRHKITPYLGQILRGSVERTYVNGQLVFKENAFVNLQEGHILKASR